jgi:hypothetical protein
LCTEAIDKNTRPYANRKVPILDLLSDKLGIQGERPKRRASQRSLKNTTEKVPGMGDGSLRSKVEAPDMTLEKAPESVRPAGELLIH